MCPLKRFAICVIEDTDARLLFLKRSPSSKLGAGQWGFPAGHIEGDETARECATRELAEEIGSHHELQEVNYMGPIRDTFYGGHLEIHLFHYRLVSATICLNAEHTDYTWANRDEFRHLDVVLGVEEDILLLGLWPRATFDASRLPRENT